MTVGLAPLTIFANRFEIEALAGSGGMGTVYRARDQQTGQRVALKILQSQGAPNEAERFAREAGLLAELHHPYIVAHVAHGTSDAGVSFLAMEWLEGEDLSRRLARGPLPLPDAVSLVRGVAAALAVAHQRGIVHRDIKPSNIFLRDGAPALPVLLDFGIARRTLRSGTLTRTGVILGTPEYMAPEQARGQRDVGSSADLFALGCVLYECITGRAPFVAEHIAAVLVKILFEEPHKVERFRPGVPPALGELLARLLRKDPAVRLGSAAALVEQLASLVFSEPDASSITAIGLSAEGSSSGEQALFSVAVAVPASEPSKPAPAMLPTLTPRQHSAELAPLLALRAQLAQLGAQLEILADGTVVATAPAAASAADQALLAVRCGLLMKERLPTAQVAVATGKGQLREQLPVGEAMDRALSLLQGAGRPTSPTPSESSEPGIWLDSLSQQLLDGRFHTERRSGRTLLLREQGEVDASRPLLGQPTPCVGREQELATLESTLLTCIEESVPRAVGVLAEPGLGKSRLRHEFMRRAQLRHPGLVILQGRGDFMSKGSPYAMLAQALRRFLGLSDAASATEQEARLMERAARHLPKKAAHHAAQFVGELCGIRFSDEGNAVLQAARRDPKVMHDQVTRAFTELMKAECAKNPILLILDDLHWGDTLTAQLIEHVLQELADTPLMVLALARPEVRELFPVLWNPQRLHELPLRALSKRASERLVQQILSRALGREVDAQLLARLVAQSGGHPLFLEELIRAAAEGKGDEQPETVRAMLQARLSHLDPLSRRVLRAASLFGESFPAGGLAELFGGEINRASTDGTILSLKQREFIERVADSRWPGQQEYRFRHALLRDAAYDLLSEEERQSGHLRVGAVLEQIGERDHLILADHYYHGGARDKAAPFYLQAAELAMNKNDIIEAVRIAKVGLSCNPVGLLRGQLMSILAISHFWRNELHDSYAHLFEALNLLPRGSRAWMQAMRAGLLVTGLLGRGLELAILLAVFGTTEPGADAKTENEETLSFLSSLCSYLGQRASAEQWLGKLKQAVSHRSEATTTSSRYLSFAHSQYETNLGYDIWGRYQSFLDAARQHQELNELRNFLMISPFMGGTLLDLGRRKEAEEGLREALQLARKLQEHLNVVTIANCIAICQLSQDDSGALQEAEALLRDVLSTSPDKRNPGSYGYSLSILARVLSALHRLGEAETLANEAMSLLEPFPSVSLYSSGTLALVLGKQGKFAAARAAAEAGLARLKDLGHGGFFEMQLHLPAVEALLGAGDLAAVRAALKNALAAVQVRADSIPDPAYRATYLNQNPDNLRLRELFRTYLGRDPFSG